MAEVVHRNLETMLPQLESLESSGIFSHDEIKMIIRRRRNHEYKLVRRPARKEDYLTAIQYEVHLDMLRKHRKKKFGIAMARKDADNGIQNRIHGLFRRALRKFKGDLKLWLQYIEFAKRCGHKSTLSKLYSRALAIHPNKPGLWVMAAKFELEELNDVSAARVLIQQGLRANSNSKHLWLEHFRLELIHVDQVRKRRAVLDLKEGDVAAPVSEDFLAFKTAMVVFKEATRVIPGDVEFHVSFLPIVQLFEDASDLQSEIYDSLKSSHPTHPLTWDALARRHWVGVDTLLLEDDQITELEEKSVEIFTEGLSALAGDQEVNAASATSETELWTKYIAWCEERQQDKNVSETLRKKSLARLLKNYNTSLKGNKLSEEMCKRYLDTLETLGQPQDALTASSLATDLYPESVELWQRRLSIVAVAGEGSGGVRTRRSKVTRKTEGGGRVGEVCREALDKVPKKDALPLWLFWLEHQLKSGASEQDTEALFQSGLSSGSAGPVVVEALLARYVGWSNQLGGIKRARTVYKRLLEQHPAPLTLFTKCIQVEKNSSDDGNIARIRKLYESALREYGSNQPGLWLDYIKTELLYSGGDPGKVGGLHWRAVKELQPELTADFISKYSLLQFN